MNQATSRLFQKSAQAWRNVAAAVLMCAFTASALAQKWEVAAPIPQGAEEVHGVAANGRLRR